MANERDESEISLTLAEALDLRLRQRIEEITATMHQLDRERQILGEQATRLRLGEAPMVVRATLRAAGIDPPG